MTYSRRAFGMLLVLAPLVVGSGPASQPALSPASKPSDTTMEDAPVGSRWKGRRNHDRKDWECSATVVSHEDGKLVLETKEGKSGEFKLKWTFTVSANRLHLETFSEDSGQDSKRYKYDGGGKIEGDQLHVEYRWTRDDRKKKDVPLEGQLLLHRVSKG